MPGAFWGSRCCKGPDGKKVEEAENTCAELEPQMQQLQKEIEMLSQQVQPKPIANYKEKLTVLQYALERYTHIDEGQNVPESVVEAFVVKIVVHPDSFDWYLRFNDDPDKPLHCTLEGKRKQTTKIMVSGGNSPTMDCSDTGRDSRYAVIPDFWLTN